MLGACDRNLFNGSIRSVYPGVKQDFYDVKTVEDVQKRLVALGFDPGPVDGKLGTKTTKAISNFQRSLGLSVSGQVDAITRVRLEIA